jgi:hypothetical protein
LSDNEQKHFAMLEEILGFGDQSTGLRGTMNLSNEVNVVQNVDGKSVKFSTEELSDVLNRFDADGKPFIQINFKSGLKVLLTDTLVGFKPKQVIGLDMAKLPKVVTTPDLSSVLEAIEDNLSSDSVSENEVEILKRVYHSILLGGELAGFDLATEREWLSRLAPAHSRASA